MFKTSKQILSNIILYTTCLETNNNLQTITSNINTSNIRMYLE